MEVDGYFIAAVITAAIAAACAVYIFLQEADLITITVTSRQSEDAMFGTMSQVYRFLDEIKEYAQAGDYEAASSTERAMRTFVLQAVADGCVNPRKIAEVALRSRDIQFPRG